MNNIFVYDVIQAYYHSFKGTEELGLFTVLFKDDSGNNILCAKITSQFDVRFLKYGVQILQRTNPFLQCDSFVQLDKLHTFNANRVIKIGSLAPVVRPAVRNMFNRFHYDVEGVLARNTRVKYVSPNVTNKESSYDDDDDGRELPWDYGKHFE